MSYELEQILHNARTMYNFVKNHVSLERFIGEKFYMLFEHMPINDDNICIIIYCQKTSGYGDIMFGVKTKYILDKYYKNVYILTTHKDIVIKICKRDNINTINTIYTIYTIDEFMELCNSDQKINDITSFDLNV